MGALKRTAMLIASEGRASSSSSSAAPLRPNLLRCRRARYTLCTQPHTASTRVICAQPVCPSATPPEPAAQQHRRCRAARGAAALRCCWSNLPLRHVCYAYREVSSGLHMQQHWGKIQVHNRLRAGC